MKQFNYNPIINGKILKDRKEQEENFFYQGHPNFLIPDFSGQEGDICLIHLDYLEKKNSCEIYDQSGGELHSYQVIDPTSGLTKCTYTAYDIMMDEDSDPEDFDVEIEGYVVENIVSGIKDYIFVATKVTV